MSQHSLKVMVDYCLNDPETLEKLGQLGALDIKTTIECGYSQNANDTELIWNATLQEDRILLTRDYNTINESRYTPCKHGGVMIIHHRRPTADIVQAFVKTLLQSGHRKFAKNHVTHLRKDGIKIVTHDPEPVIIPFNDKPNLKKIVRGI